MSNFVPSDKVNILGSMISIWNLDETVTQFKQICESKNSGYVCVSNVHTVVMGFEDLEYQKITNQAIIATADGMPLLWASKILKGTKIHGRASGPDILAHILARDDCKHIKHAFYGSTPDVLEKLKTNLFKKYPDRNFVGFYSPPFRSLTSASVVLNQEELEDCEKLNAMGADIIWVGLGAPKQEVWMYRAQKNVNAQLLVGVGAAFDFLAKTKSRAPVWMQKTGLEWFHRLLSEPKRLAVRYLKTNPIFVREVIRQSLGKIL